MSTDEIIDAETRQKKITGQEEVENDAPADIQLYKYQNIGRRCKTSFVGNVPKLVSRLCFVRYSGTCSTDIYDGLKPVQRRILHSMKRLDDGRYNKVANIVGHTMQFHPHGDASIGDALVQLGQKDLLIDCQGNWGNILTGDSAAAPVISKHDFRNLHSKRFLILKQQSGKHLTMVETKSRLHFL
jgi:topoisomerase-4 subunit A